MRAAEAPQHVTNEKSSRFLWSDEFTRRRTIFFADKAEKTEIINFIWKWQTDHLVQYEGENQTGIVTWIYVDWHGKKMVDLIYAKAIQSLISSPAITKQVWSMHHDDDMLLSIMRWRISFLNGVNFHQSTINRISMNTFFNAIRRLLAAQCSTTQYFMHHE